MCSNELFALGATFSSSQQSQYTPTRYFCQHYFVNISYCHIARRSYCIGEKALTRWVDMIYNSISDDALSTHKISAKNMNINLPLEILGLNYTEMKAYTTLLQMGSGTIQEIVHKAGIKRTTTYSVLENLIQKKLVLLVEKGGKREYFAEDPKKIGSLFEAQEKELNKKKQRMLEMLPELSSMYNAHATKPKISFYEGEEAIKSAFDETLELPAGSEILSYTNSEELTAKYMHEFILDYMEKRTLKKISNRAIAEDSPFVRKVQKKDKAQLRDMILVNSQKYPCADRINIYGDKVSIISFKNKLVLTMESESVAKTFGSLFELAWLGAQKVGKLSPNPYLPKTKN